MSQNSDQSKSQSNSSQSGSQSNSKSKSFSKESSQSEDSEIDSQEKDDIVQDNLQEQYSPLKSGLKVSVPNINKNVKSPIQGANQQNNDDEECNSPAIKRLNEYIEIDQMEYYQILEKECLDYCKTNVGKWVDSDFPPNNQILFKNVQDIPYWAQEIKTIKWYRPHEIIKDAKFMEDITDWDVKQGAFGESWFIGGLVIVNSQGDYVEKLIIDDSHFDQGFVSFQFFKNGAWRVVVVDTYLPYDPDSKQICFGLNSNQNEFWVPLCEKAYAKLHGNYETAMEGTLVEGMTDLTGGVSEKINMGELSTLSKENGQLWNQMKSYFHQKFHLGCLNFVEEKGTKNAETGPYGILENHQYGILDMRDFVKENLQLIKIRNPWGQDGGWNGPFSDDSEEWDKNRALKDEIKISQKGKKQDGTWWMSFNDFCTHFNELLICKVFNENWQQYSIMSRWQGKTAGGIFPSKLELKDLLENGTDTNNLAASMKTIPQQVVQIQQQNNKTIAVPEYLQVDSDDKWFNNPQYLVRIEKETKIYISLMQEDEKISKVNYIKCNFLVINNKNKKHRIWERPDQKDIISEAHQGKTQEDIQAMREVVQQVTLKKQEGKTYSYFIIVPNAITDNKKEEQRQFWLRIFSSEKIDVLELPETIDTQIDGGWNEDKETAGGKRRIKGKDNPNWCRNPQYFLNLKKTTHLKIILKITSNRRKNKGVRIGMTIMRFLQQHHKQEDINNQNNNPNKQITQVTQIQMFKKEDKDIQQDPQDQNTSVNNNTHTQNNNTNTQNNNTNTQKNKNSKMNNNNTNKTNNKNSILNQGINRLIASTKQQLEAPTMPELQRKLQIFTKEYFKETVYHSEELSCLYFKLNPTDGPFIIVPSMDVEDKTANFRLQIFSDNEIELEKLDENRNSVQIGSWNKEISDGGCHLYEEPYEILQQNKTWSLNPKFVLHFIDALPQYLKITVNISDKNWKAQTKNVVGGMIGIYLLRKKEGKVIIDNCVRLPNFLPLNTIHEEYNAQEIDQSTYYIMPSTYENKIQGQFILSVHSDVDFTFQPLK